jgi:hypothetical protein
MVLEVDAVDPEVTLAQVGYGPREQAALFEQVLGRVCQDNARATGHGKGAWQVEVRQGLSVGTEAVTDKAMTLEYSDPMDNNGGGSEASQPVTGLPIEATPIWCEL